MQVRLARCAIAQASASLLLVLALQPAAAKPATDRVSFILTQVGGKNFKPRPFSSVGVDVLPKDGYPKPKLECDSVSDKDGKLNCVLTSCEKKDTLRRTFTVIIAQNGMDGISGPWASVVAVKGCVIEGDTPVPLEFKFSQYQDIEHALEDIRGLQSLPVGFTALEEGAIGSEAFAQELLASRIADPVAIGDVWVIGPDMTKFVKRAQDLSALYLEVSEIAGDEAEREMAKKQAAQWSAYFKAAVNVSTLNVGRANLPAQSDMDFLLTARVGDIRANAKNLAILGAQSGQNSATADLAQKYSAFERSLAGGQLSAPQMDLWQDLVGANRRYDG